MAALVLSGLSDLWCRDLDLAGDFVVGDSCREDRLRTSDKSTAAVAVAAGAASPEVVVGRSTRSSPRLAASLSALVASCSPAAVVVLDLVGDFDFERARCFSFFLRFPAAAAFPSPSRTFLPSGTAASMATGWTCTPGLGAEAAVAEAEREVAELETEAICNL